MLIRSQNKEVLVAFEVLPDIEVSGGVISARRDMGWCCLLGEYSTKAKAIKYVCARYFLRPGKCFKYIDQRGEDVTEHVYEVMALYPYYVLLRDTRNGVRTCPGYNTLSLMLRGSEVNA